MITLNCMIVESVGHPVPLVEEYIRRLPWLRMMQGHQEAGHHIPSSVQLLFCALEWINEKQLQALRHLHPQILIVAVGNSNSKRPHSDIFGYLEQPFTFERFMQLATMARAFVELQGPHMGHGDRHFLFIKSEYKIIKIKFEEIVFCEGMKDYTQIYLKGKSTPVLTLQNLKSFYSKLPPADFVRVHRSFVVALSSIDTIARNEISIGKKIIPIGESYREHFFEVIQFHS